MTQTMQYNLSIESFSLKNLKNFFNKLNWLINNKIIINNLLKKKLFPVKFKFFILPTKIKNIH